MATTTNLLLTYLEIGQLNKEATINTNMDLIDVQTEANKHLGEYTIANLPVASSNANKFALATDAVGGRTIVRSDGTNWKILMVEGATVS